MLREGEPYPDYVRTDEDKRRYELVLRGIVIMEGYTWGQQLDGWDRMLFVRSARVLFQDRTLATGEGAITPEEREALQGMGVL